MHSKKYILLPLLLILLVAVYLAIYYPAGGAARAALESSDTVSVEVTGYGWRFDGPSEDSALVFYPGAKVEAEAYAPLLHRLAAAGLDCCLVKMPLRLAIFDADAADRVMDANRYARWYVGGHSLGGALAAKYAARNAVDGLVLCAAYPTEPLPADMIEAVLYGSEDHVLNLKRLDASRRFATDRCTECVIPGGNHAQFGDYGPQRGDGNAAISPEEQWDAAARAILDALEIESKA